MVEFLPSFDENIVIKGENYIEFPCINQSYVIFLKRGKYKLEAYGASGGGHSDAYTLARSTDKNVKGCLDSSTVTKYKGNVECKEVSSQPGSGGYSSGTIKILHKTAFFVYVGGQGTFQAYNHKGGFNGGGSAFSISNSYNAPYGSGGGATDFRAVLDSLYSRILVAGGGGGSDNSDGEFWGSDDGSGGSGGLPSQGFWYDGKYRDDYSVNSTNGFTFGQGQKGNGGEYDGAGAGGGFFGGKTYKEIAGNAGGGGGSSFALCDSVPIPDGEIEATDEDRNLLSKEKYLFNSNSIFSLTDVHFATGIWKGDGLARITILQLYDNNFCQTKIKNFNICLYNFVLINILTK